MVLGAFCLSWQGQSPPGLAVSTQKWRVPVRWEPQEPWSWALGGSEGVDTRGGDFLGVSRCAMLAPQVWQMGFGPLSLWGAVGGGHDEPLVNMQLEPPVQAAGENHSAGLPGGESRGQDPTAVRPAGSAQSAASRTECAAGTSMKGRFPRGR